MNRNGSTLEIVSSPGIVAVTTIDIVIAAKNEERYIGRCLDAISAQRYDPRLVNLVVVDNGSTDRTLEICAEKGVQVLKCPGLTVSACRNQGIRAGSGMLVAFLDAHCVAPPDWLPAMVAAFTSEHVGGSQGGLEYRCTDQRTQRLCQHSILNDKRFFQDCTIHARGAAYPWIASGNAMYRRQALEQVELHDEKLSIGEDVDLSWRVVLAGYQLAYAAGAEVIHYYTGSPLQFARRYFMYGRGGARVDEKFGLRGRELKPKKGDALASKTLWAEGLDFVRSLGRWWEKLQMALGLTPGPGKYRYDAVAVDRREPFNWSGTLSLRISPNTIYWSEGEDRFCVIALAAEARIIFQDTAATIFSCLSRGMSKDTTVAVLSAQYEVSAAKLSQELDDFVMQLVAERILEVID